MSLTEGQAVIQFGLTWFEGLQGQLSFNAGMRLYYL